METKQLLRDAKVAPTMQIIASGLGEANAAYVRFLEELGARQITLMDWRFYNDGKAWLSKGEYKWVSARGTQKVKPLFWLSIWEGFFKVSFFFSERLRAELLELDLSATVKDAVKQGKTMGESQRFFSVILDICAEEQLADIYALAQLRKEKM